MLLSKYRFFLDWVDWLGRQAFLNPNVKAAAELPRYQGRTMISTQHASTKHDILQELLKSGHATTQDLAERLEISPQAVRRHLKDLETEGLLNHEIHQNGLGRPNHIYSLSESGREQFPKQYQDFAVSLLDTLQETVGREQFSSILRQQWQRKAEDYRQQVGAGSLQERVATLVRLRHAEGYMAECFPIPAEEAQGQERYMLTEHHCAIANVAESYPSVCGHELEMFAEVLPDCTVERTHWIIDGEHRCGYLIQPNG
jgi:DeoR family transcriptional regulator, suf operon transcriptional repressor